MAGFVGRYEHSLDTKGRVILPAKFRAHFEHGGFLTEHSEGCIALWTLGEFERQMESMQEQAGQGRAERNRARVWASSSAEVEIDRQGRMPIPGHLRTFAGLENEVLVLGVIDRVELWNPAAWDEKVQPEEGWLLGDARNREHGHAVARRADRHGHDAHRQEESLNTARHQEPEDSRDMQDHVQPLDRLPPGGLLHPLPGRSFGSPPPSRPAGRGAADGPLVLPHSRAARRSGVALCLGATRNPRRRHRRRRRAFGGAPRGLPGSARAGSRPRPGGPRGRPVPPDLVRGPDHADPVPVLGLVVRDRSAPRAGRALGCAVRSRRQLTATGRSRHGASRSARTVRSTCGWTSRPAWRPPSWSTPARRPSWPHSSARTGRAASPAGSPGPSWPPGPSLRRSSWPTWWPPPYRRQPGERDIRRVGCSKRSGSR